MQLPPHLPLLALFSALSCLPSGGLCASVDTFEVPAISSVKRMPDRMPSDVGEQDVIHFIAAKGEFEAASFLIVPSESLEAVTLKASPLKGEKGEIIPEENLDLRLVKVWYQDGTAWHSYFADPTRKELVPELLLYDEALIRVDHEKQGNWLRVGDQYEWISYPAEEAKGYFNHLTEPVADAKTLQPFALKSGKNQQIWVTLKVPGDAREGTYGGTISILAGAKEIGNVKVRVRVLPFELPPPKTYYQLDNDFLVTIYRTGVLEVAERSGVPREQAVQLQRAIFRNLVDHNVLNIRSYISQTAWSDAPEKGLELLEKELQLLKESGATTRPLLTTEKLWLTASEKKDPEQFHQRIDSFREVVRRVLGHTDIYATHRDEAGVVGIGEMRENADHWGRYPDLKLWVTSSLIRHYPLAGYLIDYANQGGYPTREQAQAWHAIGAKIASYAGPHTGPENPDTFRRWEGLARYKANYDGSFNYEYCTLLRTRDIKRPEHNVWNDSGGKYRKFNMVYPTREGVIDTLAWEGFREGIDDIRYATLLKQKAKQAMDSDRQEARFQARKALMWLELEDMKKADLNAARQEIINYILEIDALLK